MKNWKKFFSKTILDRGYGYYLEGAVEDIDKEDDVISATVSGTYMSLNIQIMPKNLPLRKA